MGRKVSNQTKTKSNLWDWSSTKKVPPDFYELFTLIEIEFATRMQLELLKSEFKLF